MRTQRSGPALTAAVTTAALVAALLVGCGGDDDPLADTESIDSSAPDAGDGSQGNGGDATGTDDNDDDNNSESSSDGTGEVLGTARATLRANAIDNRSTPIRIDVVRLERHGDLVELGLLLTNEAGAPAEGDDPQDFQLDTMFGGGPASARYDASNIALVDGDAQKLYLPVLDSADECLCSGGFGAVDTPPGGTLTIDATYGGVPDDVDALDVRIPNFPVVTGVPLS